jgi:hypothetical protein
VLRQNKTILLINVTVLWLIIKHIFNRSQNSIVGTVTRLWAGWYGCQLTGRTRDFPCLQNVQSGSGTRLASYSGGIEVLCWSKVAGLEVNHFPTSSAKIKN